MFERFTDSARAVVVDARSRARAEQAAAVREEHLLASLLAAPTMGPLLDRLGLRDRAVLDEIHAARRRAGLSSMDAGALASLGVDLDAVLARVEFELGIGALDDTQRRRRRGRRKLPFSSGSKRVLQAGMHQAIARGDKEFRQEHLLLGLVAHRGPVSDELRSRGVTIAAVSAAL